MQPHQFLSLCTTSAPEGRDFLIILACNHDPAPVLTLSHNQNEKGKECFDILSLFLRLFSRRSDGCTEDASGGGCADHASGGAVCGYCIGVGLRRVIALALGMRVTCERGGGCTRGMRAVELCTAIALVRVAAAEYGWPPDAGEQLRMWHCLSG